MKILKKALLLMGVTAMLLSLCSCGSDEKNAEAVLNKAVNALQTGDFAAASGCINGGNILDNNEIFKDIENGEETEKVAKAMFSKLNCKINSSEKVDENVNINADITTIDTTEAFTSTIKELFSLALSGENMSDEEARAKAFEIFENKLKDEEGQLVTNNVNITMVKTEGDWKIELDDTLQDAITGGLLTAAENMGNSLG